MIDDMLYIEQEIIFDVNGVDFVLKSISNNNSTTTLAYKMDTGVILEMQIVKVYAYNDTYLI
jgi:hypothetical protein